MANLIVRPNQYGLKAGPLASSLKRARNLRNEEGGGSEEAGLDSLEAEAEASAVMPGVEVAAEAVEAVKVLKYKKGDKEVNQCHFLCVFFCFINENPAYINLSHRSIYPKNNTLW
jgi:hypothetical protein